jgi:putative solute:sodium symporter small subunit
MRAASTDRGTLAQRAARHWRMNLRLTGVLLAAWFAVTFGVTYFGRSLEGLFFGWPFSFWMAAQGALIVYVVLVCVYSIAMNRIDHDCGLEEGD